MTPSKLMKDTLHQESQEYISYDTYEIDTLTESIYTVMNLNRVIYYNMGKTKLWVGELSMKD